MKYRSVILSVLSCALFILAILNADLVVSGAYSGIELCVNVIIPSIFPFLFLSMLLCNYWPNSDLPFLHGICKLTGIPANNQSILLLACIGGYPIGAQVVANAWKNRSITRTQAERLMGFCNNAGPSFVFGLMSTIFDGFWLPLFLWVIHIGSALLSGILLLNKDSGEAPISKSHKDNISQIILKSVRITGTVCGWVTLFRAVLYILEIKCNIQSMFLKVVLFGLVELSNGCVMLHEITPVGLRFILASAMLSAGGFCVALQTASVAGELGLGMYVPGKFLQICISVFCSATLCVLMFRDQIYYITAAASLCSCIIASAVIKRK